MQQPETRLSKDYIQALLMREGVVGMHAVGRALLLLNERQTADERISKVVHHHNTRGFSPYDAQMGTDIAEFYFKTGFLTPKQLNYWRKLNVKGISRIGKYWRQILEEARIKQGVIQPESKKLSKKRINLNSSQSIMLMNSSLL